MTTSRPAGVDYGGARELPASLQRSTVDSRRFGRSIGRLSIAEQHTIDPSDIVSAFLASSLDILVLRYPAAHTSWHARLHGCGLVALHADTLLYFEGETQPLDAGALPPGLTAKDARSPDSMIVGSLTAEIFDGYTNHYTANPLLDGAAVVAGYEEWVIAHLDASQQQVTVLLHDGHPIALAATTTTDSMAIDLAGVAPADRGHGRYQALLRSVSARAHASGIGRITISTQAHNVAAMRAWSNLGWRPAVALETVHLIAPALADSIFA